MAVSYSYWKLGSQLVRVRPEVKFLSLLLLPPTVLGFEFSQALVLARQGLYHLSHAPALFALVHLSDRFLLLPEACLGLGSSYLFLLPSWDHRHAPLHSPCFLS
jgi:hypothetical protein